MPSRGEKVICSPASMCCEKGQAMRELSTEPCGLTVMNGKKTAGQPLPVLSTRPRLLKRAYSTLSFGDITRVASASPKAISTMGTTAESRIQRSEKEKERHPDRLSLDRMGLTLIPTFSGEEKVRLLSLQHNLITKLEGTMSLPRLVFLDLYDNQVEKIAGLQDLPNIKVLLLGKNRVRRIEGMEALTRLEVLDLHGNQLTSLAGLSPLADLKVLNVAGNQLRVVLENELRGLSALEELNLRRNRIRRVEGIGHASKLVKLFLSNNNITTVEELSGVRKAGQLKELSIDGNPVSENAECTAALVSSLPHLKLLNGTDVTSDLRDVAQIWQQEPASDKTQAISNARMHWELLRSQTRSLIQICSSERQANVKISQAKELAGATVTSIELPVFRLPPICFGGNFSSGASSELSSTSGSTRCESVFSNSASSVEPNIDSCTSSPRSELAVEEAVEEEQEEEKAEEEEESVQSKDEGKSQEDKINLAGQRPLTAQPCRAWQQVRGALRSGQVAKIRSRTAKPAVITNQKQPTRSKTTTSKIKEQGGDYLVEIEGKCLNVYGQTAIKFLDRPWNPQKANEVQTVKFTYISFNSVATLFAKIRQRFPSAENFIFKESNIYCMGQLNALAELQGINALTIEQEGNPIVFKDWQSYAVYRLAHWGLNSVNNTKVTKQQAENAEKEYGGLGLIVLHCLPGNLLLPLLGRLSLESGQPLPPPSPIAAKEWLMSTEGALRNVVAKEALQWRKGVPSQEELIWRQKGRTHLTALLETGYAAVEKLKVLDTEWNEVLQSQIQETLLDFSQMDMYTKQCLRSLWK